jgi:hypothetical protein
VNAFAQSLSDPGMQLICEQVIEALTGRLDGERH